ncbi:hypothetical protein ECMA6_3357, partial [Escherichia coli MA6]
YMPH